jgi:hypothetical protein
MRAAATRAAAEGGRLIVPRDPYEPITAEMQEALRAAWPDGERLTIAWRLARDLDALRDLLAGRPVSADRLDREALFTARRRSLVQLRAPLELVHVEAA